MSREPHDAESQASESKGYNFTPHIVSSAHDMGTYISLRCRCTAAYENGTVIAF
jgi:hypothetical protein